jgi:hypothetical protein
MTVRSTAYLCLLGLTTGITSCTSLRGGPEDIQSGMSHEGGAFVLTGAALEDGPGSIVAAMNGKVPNFRLHGQRIHGECPVITLRNAVSFRDVVNPHVYVDGIRATDTCVLEQLRTIDVERVEVYPQGFTTRPGYGMHAHGLILVFMRSAGTVTARR